MIGDDRRRVGFSRHVRSHRRRAWLELRPRGHVVLLCSLAFGFDPAITTASDIYGPWIATALDPLIQRAGGDAEKPEKQSRGSKAQSQVIAKWRQLLKGRANRVDDPRATLEPSQPDRASRSMRFPREAGAGHPILWPASLIRRLSDQNEFFPRGSENGLSRIDADVADH